MRPKSLLTLAVLLPLISTIVAGPILSKDEEKKEVKPAEVREEPKDHAAPAPVVHDATRDAKSEVKPGERPLAIEPKDTKPEAKPPETKPMEKSADHAVEARSAIEAKPAEKPAPETKPTDKRAENPAEKPAAETPGEKSDKKPAAESKAKAPTEAKPGAAKLENSTTLIEELQPEVLPLLTKLLTDLRILHQIQSDPSKTLSSTAESANSAAAILKQKDDELSESSNQLNTLWMTAMKDAKDDNSESFKTNFHTELSGISVKADGIMKDIRSVLQPFRGCEICKGLVDLGTPPMAAAISDIKKPEEAQLSQQVQTAEGNLSKEAALSYDVVESKEAPKSHEPAKPVEDVKPAPKPEPKPAPKPEEALKLQPKPEDTRKDGVPAVETDEKYAVEVDAGGHAEIGAAAAPPENAEAVSPKPAPPAAIISTSSTSTTSMAASSMSTSSSTSASTSSTLTSSALSSTSTSSILVPTTSSITSSTSSITSESSTTSSTSTAYVPAATPSPPRNFDASVPQSPLAATNASGGAASQSGQAASAPQQQQVPAMAPPQGNSTLYPVGSAPQQTQPIAALSQSRQNTLPFMPPAPVAGAAPQQNQSAPGAASPQGNLTSPQYIPPVQPASSVAPAPLQNQSAIASMPQAQQNTLPFTPIQSHEEAAVAPVLPITGAPSNPQPGFNLLPYSPAQLNQTVGVQQANLSRAGILSSPQSAQVGSGVLGGTSPQANLTAAGGAGLPAGPGVIPPHVNLTGLGAPSSQLDSNMTVPQGNFTAGGTSNSSQPAVNGSNALISAPSFQNPAPVIAPAGPSPSPVKSSPTPNADTSLALAELARLAIENSQKPAVVIPPVFAPQQSQNPALNFTPPQLTKPSVGPLPALANHTDGNHSATHSHTPSKTTTTSVPTPTLPSYFPPQNISSTLNRYVKHIVSSISPLQLKLQTDYQSLNDFDLSLDKQTLSMKPPSQSSIEQRSAILNLRARLKSAMNDVDKLLKNTLVGIYGLRAMKDDAMTEAKSKVAMQMFEDQKGAIWSEVGGISTDVANIIVASKVGVHEGTSGGVGD